MPSKKSEVRENKVLSEIVSDIEVPDTEGKVCNIHDAPVTHWCENCAEFICEDCVNVSYIIFLQLLITSFYQLELILKFTYNFGYLLCRLNLSSFHFFISYTRYLSF